MQHRVNAGLFFPGIRIKIMDQGMKERIVNIFLYGDGTQVHALGWRVYEKSGTYDELITFLQSRVQHDHRIAARNNLEKPIPWRDFEVRETVKHSVGEYVKGQAHTNGIESFWALLKRGYHGTYHQMSRKHLGRYVTEFAGRHNDRRAGTLAQMAIMVQGSDCKQLRYQDLVK